MRPLIVGLMAVTAGLAICGPACAQNSPIRVVGEIAGSDQPQSYLRAQLLDRLNHFRAEVARANRGRAAFGEFRFVPEEHLSDRANRMWKDDMVAMIWDVSIDSSYRPVVSMYVGPYRLASVVDSNVFTSVPGRLRLGTPSSTRLQMYEIIIGYALLVRAWQDSPDNVPAIASVLRQRLERERGGPNGGSSCWRQINQAVDRVSEAVIRGRRPQPGAIGLRGMSQLSCTVN